MDPSRLDWSTRPTRSKRRSAIEVHNGAAQAKLGHFDQILALPESQRFPIAALRMSFHQEFARLDHQSIKIVRRLPIAAQFQVVLGAYSGVGRDLDNEAKVFSKQLIARRAGRDNDIRLRLEIDDSRQANCDLVIR